MCGSKLNITVNASENLVPHHLSRETFKEVNQAYYGKCAYWKLKTYNLIIIRCDMKLMGKL